jgi:hypothetical protein
MTPDSLSGTDATLGSIGRYDEGSHNRLGFATVGSDPYTASFLLSAVGSEVTQLRVLTEAVFLVDGDFNGDFRVDQADLDLVLLNWGQDGSAPPSGWTTNLPSGLIDQAELDHVLLHWGIGRLPPGGIAGVPEPGGLCLAAGLLLGMAAWRSTSGRRLPSKLVFGN